MLIVPLADPGNRSLALLPPRESGHILADATLVDLTFGSTLWEQIIRRHFQLAGRYPRRLVRLSAPTGASQGDAIFAAISAP